MILSNETFVEILLFRGDGIVKNVPSAYERGRKRVSDKQFGKLVRAGFIEPAADVNSAASL